MLDGGNHENGDPGNQQKIFFHKNVLDMFTKLTILKLWESVHHPKLGLLFLFNVYPAASNCRVDIP